MSMETQSFLPVTVFLRGLRSAFCARQPVSTLENNSTVVKNKRGTDVAVVIMGGLDGHAHGIEGLDSSQQAWELYGKAAAILGVPKSMLKLVIGEQILDPAMSLQEAGVANGSVLTAVRLTAPRILRRRKSGREGNDAWEITRSRWQERLLLVPDGTCILVSDEFYDYREKDMSEIDEEGERWDVCSGTLDVRGGSSDIVWKKHVCRKRVQPNLRPMGPWSEWQEGDWWRTLPQTESRPQTCLLDGDWEEVGESLAERSPAEDGGAPLAQEELVASLLGGALPPDVPRFLRWCLPTSWR